MGEIADSMVEMYTSGRWGMAAPIVRRRPGVLDIENDFEIEKGAPPMTTPSDSNHPHSIFGASGASRWRNCSASVRVIEDAKARGDIPEKTSTSYADDGTIAHDWGFKAVSRKIPVESIPKEYRVHLVGYVGHCWEAEERAHATGGEVVILNEETVPLFYRRQDRGTVDHAVICEDSIHITDLKYGAGIKVDAMDNDQAQVYTISLIEELEALHGFDFDDDTPVFISIYQPRHYSFDGDAETWEVNVGFLRDAAKGIKADYEKAEAASLEDCTPSDKACLFCDAKAVCRARAATAFGGLPPGLDIEADFDFEDEKEDVPKGFDRETLTPGQVAWVCRNGSTLKKIIEDVTKGERARLIAGGEVREMKLIKGKLGNRVWVDEEQAEKVIRNILGAGEAYKPKVLLTAPQAVAKVKPILGGISTIAKIRLGLAEETEKTKCLIHRPEGNPKLVPVDDPGAPLTYTDAADDFDIEDDLL